MAVIDVSDDLSPGVNGGFVQEQASGVTDEIRLATQVVEAFVKVVKGFRYYPADYPLHKEYQRELFDRLWSYLGQSYSLVLQVTELTFSIDGHVAHTASELKSSVPFLLYRDGIRELLFVEGVEEWEILSLIEILTHCDKADHLEDDLVTLLWEKELVHIEYLAVDDFLDTAKEAIPENIEELRARLLSQTQSAGENDLWEGGTDNPTQEQPPAQLLESLVSGTDIYRLTTDELRRLQKEIDDDHGPAGAVHHATTLLDLLSFEHDRDLFKMIADALQNLLGQLLSANAFHLAADLLSIMDP